MQRRCESLSAGAGFTWDGMIHKITPKQWDAMLAVHCTAPFRLIQACGLVIIGSQARTWAACLSQPQSVPCLLLRP